MYDMRCLLAASLALLFFFARTSGADPVIPPDLPDGSLYQLVFVTSGTRDALSTDIADYNTFVSQAAALSSSLPAGVTWKAIASTAAVGASTNAVVAGGIPIYNTNGQVVGTAASTRIYGGSGLFNPIAYDENGNYLGGVNVWTGTSSGVPGIPFPGAALGQSRPIAGHTLLHTSIGWNANTFFDAATQNHLYALSSPITHRQSVAPVPEGSSLSLLVTGLGILCLRAVSHRRANAQSAALGMSMAPNEEGWPRTSTRAPLLSDLTSSCPR